jgi:hypothetical protein
MPPVRFLLAASLLIGHLTAADGLTVTCDDAVRAGIPFLVTVSGQVADGGVLRLRLEQATSVASDEVTVSAAALAAGVRVCLIPASHGPAPARLQVVLGRIVGGIVASAPPISVPTASGVRADFQAASALLPGDGATDDDQRALWRLLGAQALDGPPSLAALVRVTACTKALRGTPDGRLAGLRPWRDPIDGGLRPLYTGEGRGPTVVVLGPPGADRLVSAYQRIVPPPGSTAWMIERLGTILADRPVVVVASGDGLRAGRALADLGASVILVDAPADADPGVMACPAGELPHALELAQPRPVPAGVQHTGDLSAYADAPFTLVVGTAEHAAAAADNAMLAGIFRRDWTLYAGAAPREVPDTAPLPAGNLVLVGNPRSHRGLGRLVADGLNLPLAWDPRMVTLGDTRLHRSLRPAIAWSGRHDGRTILVLDGSPAWAAAGDRPLTGLNSPILAPRTEP